MNKKVLLSVRCVFVHTAFNETRTFLVASHRTQCFQCGFRRRLVQLHSPSSSTAAEMNVILTILCAGSAVVLAQTQAQVQLNNAIWRQTIANYTQHRLIQLCPYEEPEWSWLDLSLASDLSTAVLYLTVGGCHSPNNCTRTCVETALSDLRAIADDKTTPHIRLDSLNRFLRKVETNYKPISHSPTQQCVSSQDILEQLQLANQSVSTLLATHLLKGDCFVTSSDDHATGYVWTAGNDWSTVNESVFTQLINDINSVSRQCQCRSKRCRRHATVETTPSTCIDGKVLFGISDEDHSGRLSREELMRNVCPPLMDQMVSSGTIASPNRVANTTDQSYSSNSIAYIYGTIAVAIISLCSVFGVVIIPCLKSHVYNYVMTALIGMGFGILAGDAILHLIPQALGLHDIIHEDSGAGATAHSTETIPGYLAICIGILSAIYGLFLFESLTSIISPHSHDHGHQENHEDGHGHEHTNNKVAIPVQVNDVKKSLEILEIGDHGLQTSSNSSLYGESSTSGEMVVVELAAEAPVICCQLKSLALVITLGDTVHNFADGMVIGAAFASGVQGGLSSSLAIFCHEIPHELGDFAILLSTGLSQKKVIVINLLSSLSSFAGLYIGVAIGSDQSAVRWTLALTAGLFLFVALGDMMPELKQKSVGSPWKQLLTQNVAVLTGMIFTVFMSIYEDEIRL